MKYTEYLLRITTVKVAWWQQLTVKIVIITQVFTIASLYWALTMYQQLHELHYLTFITRL